MSGRRHARRQKGLKEGDEAPTVPAGKWMQNKREEKKAAFCQAKSNKLHFREGGKASQQLN